MTSKQLDQDHDCIVAKNSSGQAVGSGFVY